MKKPNEEMQTVDELKKYLSSRISFFIGKMENCENVFDVEAQVYAIGTLAEHVHKRMHRLNSESFL